MKIARFLVTLAVLCFCFGIGLIPGPSDIVIATSVLFLVLAGARVLQVAISQSASDDLAGPTG